MAKYNLSKNVAESFDFTINDPDTGKELSYKVRYPSAADFEPSKDVDVEIDDLKAKMNAPEATLDDKKRYQTQIDELEKKKASMFYGLVTPVEHEVSIENLLQKVNIITVKNFNNMISSEFGA